MLGKFIYVSFLKAKRLLAGILNIGFLNHQILCQCLS